MTLLPCCQADQCVLLPIMGSREVDDGSVKSEDLAAKIPGSIVVDGLESAANWVKAERPRRRPCGFA